MKKKKLSQLSGSHSRGKSEFKHVKEKLQPTGALLERVFLSKREHLPRLPDLIDNLKHLQYLDLSYTSINDIPNPICSLSNLQTLLLSNCENLTRLPDSIGNLKHLRHLNLSSTSINDIPDSIGSLSNLQTLLLSNCENLTRLPVSIGNLKHLRHLNLSSTSINDIPDSIGSLSNLETVLLSNCENLTRLPDSIGDLKHLWCLDLSSTSINDIPDSICSLSNLETLLLSNCENLNRLPSEIGHLIKLCYLDFAGSPIKEHSRIEELGDLQQLHREFEIWGRENVVDPSDIQKQRGSYAAAFVEHEQRFNNTMDKVQALKEPSELSGWDSWGKSESVTVDADVKHVKEKLQHIGPDALVEDLPKSLKPEENRRYSSPFSVVYPSLRKSGFFIGNLKDLRYLNLSSTSINGIPDLIGSLSNLETVLLSNCKNLTRLPDSIGNLKHLRYLDSSSTSIKDIPDTICTLYNLETLLLSNCENLTRLPSEIRCLIKLRYLDFAGSPIKELPPQICKLKVLQTLTRFIVCKEHSRIEELGDLQQLHGEFEICGLENVVDVKKVSVAKLREKKFLTSLGLYWDGESCDGTLEEREILNLLQPHEYLKALRIYGFAGERFPDWMGDQSFGDMVEVQLSECKNCCQLPPLGQLPSLKNLHISGFKSLVTIGWEFFSDGSSTTKPFRSLEVLRFEDMAIWQEFLFTEDQVFPSLKELVFYKCPKLDVWLPDCFPSLTKLLVSHCRQLMPLLLPMTHQRFGFQSLEELEIFACPKQVIFLQEGWPSSLKKIKISRCESLKLLHCIHSKKEKEHLHSKDFQHLTSLQSLEIRECKELHHLPEELPTYPFELSIVECPFLESGGWENEEDWPN